MGDAGDVVGQLPVVVAGVVVTEVGFVVVFGVAVAESGNGFAG